MNLKSLMTMILKMNSPIARLRMNQKRAWLNKITTKIMKSAKTSHTRTKLSKTYPPKNLTRPQPTIKMPQRRMRAH